MYDILIKNALIVDGTGTAPYRGAVGIRNGLIEHIEPDRSDDRPQASLAMQADQVIDAHCHALAPGFIDLHSHADFTIQGNPAAETQLAQGVTTALTGNCGATPFPTRAIESLKRDHAHLDPTFHGDWTDASGFADCTRHAKPGINIATQIGLSTLRSHVVGEQDRPATASEIERMKQEIQKAADQGVRGFSSGLIYVPGSYAKTDEIIELASTAAENGLLYSTHMRNEAGDLLDAVREAISTADRSGVRLEISHLKAMGPENHGKTHHALKLIDEARDRGVDVTADVYPYIASSTTLTSRLAGEAMDGGKSALLERLADSDQRRSIASALASRFGRDIDPGGVIIADVGGATSQRDMSWTVGRSLTEIADEEGCSEEEAALRVLECHGASVAIVNRAMSEQDVQEVLRHSHVSVASDGWTMSTTGSGQPHPRSFGTFARVLGHYVRDVGLLSVEEAVRKMTSLPASRLGLKDRGLIRTGMVADLCLFDPATVRDNATFESPWQLASGVSHVLVNGKFAWRDGAVSEQRHGQVL